jgi:HlyD family secretion protein
MIGAVSPSDALLIETFVSPKDVGLLRLGQPARLQIDAYPYTQWGLLDATVMTLAADSSGTNGANSTSGFKVTLQPTATTLYLPNGTAGPLRKGLTLSARFVVARRSLLQTLYEDVSAWLNPQEPQSRAL